MSSAEKVSFRLLLRHPSMHPSAISNALGWEPARSVNVGDDVVTPAGTRPGTKFRYTAVTYTFDDADTDTYSASLREVCSWVAERRSFFSAFHADAGTSELTVTVETEPRSFVFDADVLEALASCRVDLTTELVGPPRSTRKYGTLYLSMPEKAAAMALARAIGDDAVREQCIADLEVATVAPANFDGTILRFHYPDYKSPERGGQDSFRGTDGFPVEGEVLDFDGVKMDVILFGDQNDRLYEFELVKHDASKAQGPDWTTFRLK